MTSARTTVLHVVSGDSDSLIGAITVAHRIADVADQRGVRLEMFVFAGAQRALSDPQRRPFNAGIDELVRRGVRVAACSNFARKFGAVDALSARGVILEPARDAFIRFTLARATVITL
jgi:hypothetical protein